MISLSVFHFLKHLIRFETDFFVSSVAEWFLATPATTAQECIILHLFFTVGHDQFQFAFHFEGSAFDDCNFQFFFHVNYFLLK